MPPGGWHQDYACIVLIGIMGKLIMSETAPRWSQLILSGTVIRGLLDMAARRWRYICLELSGTDLGYVLMFVRHLGGDERMPLADRCGF